MNNEKAKSSKSIQKPLTVTGCSLISFLITLILGIVLVILVSILPFLYVMLYVGFDSKNVVYYVIGILLLMLMSVAGATYSLGKKLEHWTHLIVRYRGMQHERKRIERLIQKDNSQNSNGDLLLDTQANDNIKEHSQH